MSAKPLYEYRCDFCGIVRTPVTDLPTDWKVIRTPSTGDFMPDNLEDACGRCAARLSTGPKP